jgi:hypothetical protein
MVIQQASAVAGAKLREHVANGGVFMYYTNGGSEDDADVFTLDILDAYDALASELAALRAERARLHELVCEVGHSGVEQHFGKYVTVQIDPDTYEACRVIAARTNTEEASRGE